VTDEWLEAGPASSAERPTTYSPSQLEQCQLVPGFASAFGAPQCGQRFSSTLVLLSGEDEETAGAAANSPAVVPDEWLEASPAELALLRARLFFVLVSAMENDNPSSLLHQNSSHHAAPPKASAAATGPPWFAGARAGGAGLCGASVVGTPILPRPQVAQSSAGKGGGPSVEHGERWPN